MQQHPLSPYSALSMLLLFKQRRIDISEAQFDLYMGTICEVLEQANDEKWRLEPNNPEG